MQINYPKERHGLPPEHEVRNVVLVLCRQCGYDQDYVRLQYIGGDRRRFFPKQGIKLMRGCPFTVQLYVGCNDETVETHFQLINGNGRARDGHTLFQEMNRSFNGRLMIVTNEMIRELRTGISRNTADRQEPESPTNPVNTTDDTAPVMDVDQTEIVGDVSLTNPAPAPQESLGVQVQYKKYFDDPAKLHLGVCALVALCDEDTQRPFSFKDFEKVIAELNVPKGGGIPMVFIRVFTARGFVTRLNPDSEPPRYAITDFAVKFAIGPIPDSMVKTKMQLEAVDRGRTPRAKPPTDIKHSLLELKAKAAEHQTLKDKLATVQSKLTKLREVEINTEKKNVEAEIKSHQKRIGDLRMFLDNLEKRREEIQATEKEVKRLNEALNDSDLLQALTQLEELRKLISS